MYKWFAEALGVIPGSPYAQGKAVKTPCGP
jgi:hypothetical protein